MFFLCGQDYGKGVTLGEANVMKYFTRPTETIAAELPNKLVKEVCLGYNPYEEPEEAPITFYTLENSMHLIVVWMTNRIHLMNGGMMLQVPHKDTMVQKSLRKKQKERFKHKV